MNESKSRWTPFVFISAPFFLLFLLTTNQLFTFDSLTNALAAETNNPQTWFHSNHPLYPFLGMVWFRIEKLFGYHGYSIYSLARFNSLLTSLALGLFFLTLRKFVRVRVALVTTFILGGTYAVWFYATDGIAIGCSIFFSVLVVSLMLNFNQKENLSNQELLILITASTLLTLVHGIALLHVFAVAWWLWKKEGWKSTGIYTIGTTSAIGAVYFLIYFLIVKKYSPTGFLNWSLGYAAFEGSTNVLKSAYWSFSLKNILVGLWNGWINAITPQTWLSHLLGLLTLGGIFVGFILSRKLSPELKRAYTALMIWGLVIHLFLAFWSPGQLGFRLHVLIPWLTASALAFGDSKKIFLAEMMMGILIFTLNFTGPIYQGSFIRHNVGYQILNELDSLLQKGDFFICTRKKIPNVESLRAYFFPHLMGGTIEGRLFEFREQNVSLMFDRLHHHLKQGAHIYFLEDVFDSKTAAEIEGSFGLKPGEIQMNLSTFNFEKIFQLSNGETVFRASEKKG